jgi:hypothetical protein
MRKQDLTLDTVFALNRGNVSIVPVVLASLSEEFHVSRGEVGRGSPTGRLLRTAKNPGRNGYPARYLGVTRYPDTGVADETEQCAVASRVGVWLSTLLSNHYARVPDGLIPEGFRLVELRTRELLGEWATVQAERDAAEAEVKAARAERDEINHQQMVAFETLRAVAERLGLDRAAIEPFTDYRNRVDYACAVVPVADLLAVLRGVTSEG